MTTIKRNHNLHHIFLIIVVIVSYVGYLNYKVIRPQHTRVLNINHKFHFGNKLSSYFYFLTVACIKKKKYLIKNNSTPDELLNSIIPKKSISSFVFGCPKYLSDNLQHIEKITPESFWYYRQYLIHIYPLIKKNI